MDYEMKYKELAGKMKMAYLYAQTDSIKALLEDIMPELKINEYERIRKDIIVLVKDWWDRVNKDNISTKEQMLAWLEKQGEQKSADKVESKFKVGDWVVQENIGTYKVVEVCESWYEVIDDQNNRYSIGFDKEYMCHLWTINDAKDGDVLVGSDGSIFLFAGVVDCACKYYIALTTDNYIKINKEAKGGYWETSRAVYPATNEQCDLLFKKMHEAGYEWDKEKKEPKKIVAPKFNIHDCVIKKHNSNINDFGYFIITDITDGKYWYNDRIICDITEQDEWEIYEPVRQNSTWSEEDEDNFNCCIGALKSYFGEQSDEFIDWLKTLKHRKENNL